MKLIRIEGDKHGIPSICEQDLTDNEEVSVWINVDSTHGSRYHIFTNTTVFLWACNVSIHVWFPLMISALLSHMSCMSTSYFSLFLDVRLY